MDAIEFKKAGFWVRLLATWIDCLFIYLVLTIVFYLLLYTKPFYFPFNFSLLITGIIYSTILITFKGHTIGKYLLGLTVYNIDNTKISFIKSFLRESILKIVSGIALFLGFFWIGFSKSKKGWHDYMCKSIVVRNSPAKKGTIFWRVLALSSFLIFFISYVWNFTSLIIEANQMALRPASIRLPFMNRNPTEVTDVSAIKDTSFVSWLDKNAQSPQDFALHIAATHQITLFGEAHENAANLHFFNQLIEPLYYKSGIRVIAMEVIPASMNKKVDALVNGKEYDSALALEIARSQSWKMWGFKEYWDLLQAVWTLNNSLPKGAERMRVVGIDDDLNMVNISLLGISKDDSKGKPPFWEKFRFFSVIADLPNVIYRDNLMARNVEKEIIDKNQKAVVLIGFNHTMINYTWSTVKDNKILAVNPRFGVLLSQKYKDKFFQIELYQQLDLNEDNSVCKNSIDGFLDSVFKKRAYKPTGFTIASSPFEKIRDSCSFYWSQFPSVCYGDIAQGLIFLTPFASKNKCTWVKGYISDEMFMKYKPMYDLIINNRIKFKNAKDLNQIMSEN